MYRTCCNNGKTFLLSHIDLWAIIRHYTCFLTSLDYTSIRLAINSRITMTGAAFSGLQRQHRSDLVWSDCHSGAHWLALASIRNADFLYLTRNHGLPHRCAVLTENQTITKIIGIAFLLYLSQSADSSRGNFFGPICNFKTMLLWVH